MILQVSNVKSLNKYRWTHVALRYDGSSNTMYQYQDEPDTSVIFL